MGREGPLEREELSTIDELLDAGALDDAQQQLAGLGHSIAFDAGTTYLATRLLYLRGRLDAAGVAQRLRDLLATTGDFPEARRLLAEAEQDAPASSIPPGGSSSPVVEVGVTSTPISDMPASEPAAGSETPESDEHRRHFVRTSSIPRAPGVPHFSEPPDPGFAQAGGSGDDVQHISDLPPPDSDTREIPDLVPPDGEAREIPDLAPPGGGAAVRPVSAARDATRPTASGYSEHRKEVEHIAVPGRPVRAPRTPPAADRRQVRSAPPPPPAPDALPSLFELATLLDEGHYRRIVDAIDSASDAGPGYVLMRARALAGEGRLDEARTTLERLTRAPLLDPELRAGAARVLIDLGDLSAALVQARQAHDDDPQPPLVNITLAWTLLRGACRRSDARAVEEATELLSRIAMRGGPRPALVAALRALSRALSGDPERAIGAAQRALELDATSTDALAAIALASARLEREHDAQQAWLRLLELSYEQADAISDELEALGVELSHLDPSLRPGAGHEAIFEPLERMPGDGRRPEAIAAFEQLARARLTELAEHGTKHDFSIIAPVAASFLATSAVSRDFPPWDLSLWSVVRVDAFAATLYGGTPHPRESDDFPVILLLGSYLGEAIRSAHGGRWEGSVAHIDTARVTVGERSWAPFEMVRARIERGTPLDAGLAPGGEAPEHRTPTPATPPCPWDPLAWPKADMLEDLGRALAVSPVGAWCAAHAGGPLDLSLASLAVLDRYVDLVAPLRASPEPDAPWSRRPAVLLGAYVGEVLRAQLGGSWRSTDARGAGRYALDVDDTRATPVVEALARVEGRSKAPLSAYARKISSG